jgi:hypothetical protein
VKTYPTFVSKGWKIIAELEEVFSLITRITSNGCRNEIENRTKSLKLLGAPDFAVRPPDQKLADLAPAPMRLLARQADNQGLDPGRQAAERS